MVQDIERVRAQLQRKSLRDAEIPGDREVHLREAEAGYVVASLGSLSNGARNSECRRIEAFSAGARRAIDCDALGSVEPNRLPGHAIRTGICISSRVGRSREHYAVKGQSAASHNDGIDRPVF